MKHRTLLFFLAGCSIGLLFSFFLLNKDIDREMVHQAADLIGLKMTDSEIETMLPDLVELRDDYQKMREGSIPNETPPALIFNPLPEGVEIPTSDAKSRFSVPRDVPLPDKREELAFYSVGQLASLLQSGKITSEELTRFFLDRLQQHDPTLHCVITLTEERALAQARRMDRELAAGNIRGPLHGIPFGAKDLLAAKDYKTTWGATPYKEQQLDYDAAVIEKLEEAGAVLVAKLTLGALAWGDVWYGGRTRNPWSTDEGSSGSSAGSASAVSAGLVPFAIGTETYGSIVSPSTVCGTTGLRPTFGRVSRYGAMALSWTMDKIGPICRTVEDCAMVFDAIYGKDARDPFSMESSFAYRSDMDAKTLKVGYLKSIFEEDYGFKQQDSLTLLTLQKAGIELVPIELPDAPALGFILSVEAAAAFDELTRSGRDDELIRQVRYAWPNVFRQARFVPAVEYVQANRLRSQLIQDFHEAIKEVDVYLSPSWHGPNLYQTNLTGHPCVVLPNGFIDGKPTSITFNGHLFGEEKVLALAKFYQELTDFHLKHPESFE